MSAISALDWACWDAVGRERAESVSSMLGRVRDVVDVYVGGALWWSADRDQLAEEAAQWEQLGYKALKMRAGLHAVAEGVARVRAVRETLSHDVRLMIDCVQLLDRSKAIELGQALADLCLTWIEDPLVATDIAGHAELSKTLSTPVATGEHEYGRTDSAT